MKTMSKSVFALFLVLGLSVAMAQPGKGGKCDCKHESFMNNLNLNEKQQSELTKIRKEHRDEMHKLGSKNHELRFEMLKAIEEGKSEKDAKKIADKIADLTKEKLYLRIEMMNKMRSILTEEQRKKAEMLPFMHGERGMNCPMGKNRGGKMDRKMGPPDEMDDEE